MEKTILRRQKSENQIIIGKFKGKKIEIKRENILMGAGQMELDKKDKSSDYI